MVRMRSLCRLYTKHLANESVASANVRTGTRRVATLAKNRKKLLAERQAVRKKAKGKRKGAREKPERVGRAARQDTLHRRRVS